MKGLQVALLAVIAAALVWGGASVRSFPRRILAGNRPAPSARPWHVHCWRLGEAGRELPHTDAYFDTTAPASLVAQGRMCMSSAPQDVRDAWYKREMEAFRPRQAPRKAPIRNRIHVMECDLPDYIPFDSADARWCTRVVQYLAERSDSTVDSVMQEAAVAAASRPEKSRTHND